MVLNGKDYRKKVLGCWMGKNIGGTLGAPFEWRRQVNEVSFYTQDLHGEPLPNDDLDIQLLWLVALEEQGIKINARTLGEYWLLYVTPHWSEYGNAKINMRSGLMPPLSGTLNNAYKDSCGSFIRSEIWACIAPGAPSVAVRYAYEDAIIDHGNGEGMYASVFCAALESAAFVESDIHKLVGIGLSFIPEDCGVAKAVRCAVEAYRNGQSWLAARHEILEKFRGECFFGLRSHVSAEDQDRGFMDGQRGWDAPSNIALIVIGLLYGEGDFETSMCLTVNCGEDTDCTAATVGSVFGIIHGLDAIPDRWVEPIGRRIKTACLNLGELGYFGNQLPADIDELSMRVERIARQVGLACQGTLRISDTLPTDVTAVSQETFDGTTLQPSLYRSLNGPVYAFDFFDICVDYADGPLIRDNTPKTITLTIVNRYKVQEMLNIRWYLPDGWMVSPSDKGKVFLTNAALGQGTKGFEFELSAERVNDPISRCVVEFTVEGKHTVMLVPVVLLNGNI